ncbi:5-guanidino-2-oxopentanoate decarboxylase [Mesorhizobium sp. SB112]|uniref:5-guanidino-2-oxopentanoate decarboxylase n=1 Tax=Mesorhizobium sp. SB112 TaxID=3151853 RepID=UPI0032653A05
MTEGSKQTVGEALISLLEAHRVQFVFGIPGVHTLELYRGLASSTIRHITPRHEQGAGFMADGYARVSGKPGVAFVITGPGLTNTITAMGQARADSIPMLVISSVNKTETLGKGLGYLHELPDQRGLIEKVALFSHRIEDGNELPEILARAFTLFAMGRAGPVHIEIPMDVLGKPIGKLERLTLDTPSKKPNAEQIVVAQRLIGQSQKPVILAGGGAKGAEAALQKFAGRLDAPVVLTANARGLLYKHPLCVPASPSLKGVRKLIDEADLVIAVGTEFGPTDYDMYGDGGFSMPENLIRIDIDKEQLKRRSATLSIEAEASIALDALKLALPAGAGTRGESGAARAKAAREAALGDLDPVFQKQLPVLEAIRDTLPGAIIIGDSTQPIYAGNLYYDHDRPAGWFNAATGFGALGYGPPAAIGAALAMPDAPVVCLTGDGGLQFTLAELGAARDAKAAVIFVVWNNRGYREIETSMLDVGIEPVGVSPEPPDFTLIAKAYGIAAERVSEVSGLVEALKRAREGDVPYLIEFMVD